MISDAEIGPRTKHGRRDTRGSSVTIHARELREGSARVVSRVEGQAEQRFDAVLTSPAPAPAGRPVASDDRAELSAARRRPRRRLGLGWEPPDKLDRAGWLAAGTSLAEFGRVNNWWVGDWIRYGNARWGEKYVEAARITGLDGKTLRNIAYVASRFDLSRRRDKLTWTHHAEVAALAPAQQEEWLDRVLEQRLSPGDLRLELRAVQRALKPAAGGDGEATGAERAHNIFTCPQCGGAIPLSELRHGAARSSRRNATATVE